MWKILNVYEKLCKECKVKAVFYTNSLPFYMPEIILLSISEFRNSILGKIQTLMWQGFYKPSNSGQNFCS